MHYSAKSFYERFNNEEIDVLRSYLAKRYLERKARTSTGVVFDILHTCILQCKGCGTNATFSNDMHQVSCSPSLDQIEAVFKKLKQYETRTGKTIFLNVGGGEPFLRSDIIEILKMAADYFGSKNVGVDSNAALDCSEALISEAMPYVSYVGVSINGLKEYHNWWAGNNRIDAFSRAVKTVSSLCANPLFREKIEVTSVASKKNMNELQELMIYLSKLGVKKYSVHRAIPVGRMADHQELIPDATDYIKVLISLIRSAAETEMDIHVHHSIESIHAALLLGIDTYHYDHIGNPDALSSIGIDPECNLVFDPWCTIGWWKNLSSGNLLTDSRTLDEMIRDEKSAFQKARESTSFDFRCKGCQIPCSGGSRIVAAAHELCGIANNQVLEQDVYNAMRSIDPACPLYV